MSKEIASWPLRWFGRLKDLLRRQKAGGDNQAKERPAVATAGDTNTKDAPVTADPSAAQSNVETGGGGKKPPHDQVPAWKGILKKGLLYYTIVVLAGCVVVFMRIVVARACVRLSGPLIPLVDARERNVVASRALPANHQLRKADLRVPSSLPATVRADLAVMASELTTQWLRRSKRPHEPITAADVADTPDVSSKPSTAIIAIAIPDVWTSKLIDADMRVNIVSDAKTKAHDATVVAVQCSDSTKCTALVRVTEKEMTDLTPSQGTPTLVLLGTNIVTIAPAPAPPNLAPSPPKPVVPAVTEKKEPRNGR
jgi:hypothetical protein